MACPGENVGCQGEIGGELCLVTLAFSCEGLLSIPCSSNAVLIDSVMKL